MALMNLLARTRALILVTGRALVRDERGMDSNALIPILMTAAGVATVGIMVPTMFQSGQTAANTMQTQAQALQQGATGGGAAGSLGGLASSLGGLGGSGWNVSAGSGGVSVSGGGISGTFNSSGGTVSIGGSGGSTGGSSGSVSGSGGGATVVSPSSGAPLTTGQKTVLESASNQLTNVQMGAY
jgi:hypothetical protein